MNRIPVDFYFDFTSPYSYLASTQFAAIESWGAEIRMKPIFLAGLMKTLGSTPPIQLPGAQRAAYLLADVARWARTYGVPMQLSPYFPVNTLLTMRPFPYIREQGLEKAWFDRCFRAVWQDGLDVADAGEVATLAMEVGLDAEAVLGAASKSSNKEWLKQETQNAIERGVFGVPTFFVGDEMIFGNDRLLFVKSALEGTL